MLYVKIYVRQQNKVNTKKPQHIARLWCYEIGLEMFDVSHHDRLRAIACPYEFILVAIFIYSNTTTICIVGLEQKKQIIEIVCTHGE